MVEMTLDIWTDTIISSLYVGNKSSKWENLTIMRQKKKYILSGWKIHCSIKFSYFLSNYITELYYQPNRSENLEVEPNKEVDVDKKGPFILNSEAEKAMKEKRDRKAMGDDDVSVDVFNYWKKVVFD